MFSVHTSLEKFENATITSHFGFVFEEIVTSSFWKSSILIHFPSTLKHKAGVFKFVGFEQCFRLKSAHFRDELLWTEDLTVEIKLRFQISLA